MAMWLIVFFVCLTSLASAQNEIGASQERGHGWDIRLAVPGEPGIDYPTLGVIPRTKFSCAGRDPGYFADVEAGCQVFRVCTVGSTYGFQSFLCPNGTLFNQAVFVCDWWMNVRCQESQQLLNIKNEQFGNLRLGPQLMKDVKKMLTHPMRNPYNRNSMKSKQIIMQDYRPPTGQLFPNEALIAGPERLSNKVHMPAKQVQQNIIQNSFSNIDNAYTTTSSDTKLLPAAFSTVSSLIRSNEIIQRQRSDTRVIQSTQIPLSIALVSNGHARQFENNNLNTQLQRPTQNHNFLNQQKQSNTATQTKNTQNNQRAQLVSQRTQYVDNKKALQSNLAKHSEFGRSIKQNILNSNQNYPAYTYRPPLPLNLNDIPGNVADDVKQNVVSTAMNIQPTVVTRPTAAARSLKESKPNRPRSRITIKTWLVKPTRVGRVITNPAPTPYSYSIPTISSTEKLIDSTTPYVYNTPTAETLSEIDEEIQPTPYYYSRPTVFSRQIVSSTTRDPPRYYLPPLPTTPEPNPTLISRFDIPYSTPSSYMNNDEVLISPSSTSQPGSRYYLPPDNYPTLSRQYLPSNQELPYQISQLKVTSSAPSPVYVSTTVSQTRPTVMVTQQAPINTNSDTLSFADILTKEKLDITVNDIVKDTDSILRTASPENIGHYREITKISDYRDDNYLPTTTDSGESLTSQVPIMPSISSRALELPVNHLVPPKESMPTQSTNKLSFLPYFKESLLPAPNTIERTVSLKITIPERIATYLFKNNNDSDFDRLEILNTGSSNYLVLSNNLITSTSPSIVPIGKLVGSKTKNISNSQALVFSLLADSINAAKEYTSIAQQESLSTTLTPPPLPTPQFPNINNGDLSQITNGISQLTASQYSGNNYNSANLVSFTSQTPQTISTAQSNQFANNNVNANHQKPAELQSAPYNVAKPRQIQDPFYSPQPSIDNSDLSALLNGNNNQIYSGQLYQLPVPEVTNQLINKPNTGEAIQYNNIPQTNSQQLSSQNTGTKQPRTEVEVVKSQSVPINSNKIELEPTTEPESVSSDESLKNLLNSNNGISAHLQDKIIGTIPHPLEQNKLVTYEKEKSYYLFSKVDNDISQQESKSDALTQINKLKSDIVQTTASTNGFPNSLAFQLLPSINYQIEDEKDQQKLLNTFEIDEFGAPREVKANLVKDDLINNVDYSVDYTTTEKQDNQLSSVTTLYNGPSSYLAPQSSIGELSSKKEVVENNVNSKLETLDNSDGYPKERPTREFTF